MKPRMGLASGIAYFMTYLVITPILILLDPEFDISILDFDPLSQLGVSSETILFYNIVMFFDGIFLFLYYHWYLSSSRPTYNKLKGWQLSINTGKAAGIGQIGLAAFFNIDILHGLHIIAGIIFFAGVILSMFVTSLDVEHLSKQNHQVKVLTRITMFTILWGVSYPFIFRFTDLIGLWQFVIVSAMFFWYFYENNSHTKISAVLESELSNDYDYPVKLLGRMGIVFGILLFVLGLILLLFPEYDPTPCGDVGDRKNCHPEDNVISCIAGIILISISLYIKKFQYISSPGAVLK